MCWIFWRSLLTVAFKVESPTIRVKMRGSHNTNIQPVGYLLSQSPHSSLTPSYKPKETCMLSSLVIVVIGTHKCLVHGHLEILHWLLKHYWLALSSLLFLEKIIMSIVLVLTERHIIISPFSSGLPAWCLTLCLLPNHYHHPGDQQV